MRGLDAKFDRFLEREFNYDALTKNNDKCVRDFFKFLHGGVVEQDMIHRAIFANGFPLWSYDTKLDYPDLRYIRNRTHDIWMMRFLKEHEDEFRMYLL